MVWSIWSELRGEIPCNFFAWTRDSDCRLLGDAEVEGADADGLELGMEVIVKVQGMF